MLEEVYKSEWIEWRKSKVTKFLLNALSEFRKNKLESIAHGHATGIEELYTEIGRMQGIEDSLHFLVSDAEFALVDDSEVEDGTQS